MGCRRLFPVKTELWIAVVILVPLLISFILKQRKIPLLHESKNSSNHRQFAHLFRKYLRMSARKTTGFKSLVTFDFCKNYKQQCMFSYLEESNVLPHLQEFKQKCGQPCKTTMESTFPGMLQRQADQQVGLRYRRKMSSILSMFSMKRQMAEMSM